METLPLDAEDEARNELLRARTLYMGYPDGYQPGQDEVKDQPGTLRPLTFAFPNRFSESWHGRTMARKLQRRRRRRIQSPKMPVQQA